METEELRIARGSLLKQFDEEVLRLKDYLKDISEKDLLNPQKTGAIVEEIFCTCKGIEKIAHVMEYIDAWSENGDPPQFRYTRG